MKKKPTNFGDKGKKVRTVKRKKNVVFIKMNGKYSSTIKVLKTEILKSF